MIKRLNLLILCALFSYAGFGDTLESSIIEYQKALIAGGVTGSSIAGVFRGDKIISLTSVTSDIEGDRPISESTLFPIWSMSKPITITAMMVLLDRNKFKLDDPVKKYIPYFENIKCKSKDSDKVYSCSNDLLVEHLLSHRSGYKYYKNESGPDHRDPYLNLDEFVRHLSNQPLEFEPGSDYIYGLNQAILGRLIEVITGKEFIEFLKEEIFDPLGMTDTKFSLTQKDRSNFQPLFRKANDIGIDRELPDQGASIITTDFDELDYIVNTKKQLGGEGLISSFRDYRRFCEMLLAGGDYKGKKILSDSSFELMTSIVTPNFLSRGFNNGLGIAYSFFVVEEPILDGTSTPKGSFGWSGYHNTHFWIDQKNNIFGLFMTRTTPFTWEIEKHFRAVVYDSMVLNK